VKKKKPLVSGLIDALRNDSSRITTEEIIYFHGVPIYSFNSWPKACLKCGIENCKCGKKG
jgi:hypothetical protein